jgi:hypothetical protein
MKCDAIFHRRSQGQLFWLCLMIGKLVLHLSNALCPRSANHLSGRIHGDTHRIVSASLAIRVSLARVSIGADVIWPIAVHSKPLFTERLQRLPIPVAFFIVFHRILQHGFIEGFEQAIFYLSSLNITTAVAAHTGLFILFEYSRFLLSNVLN